jgi:hypothetical protein
MAASFDLPFELPRSLPKKSVAAEDEVDPQAAMHDAFSFAFCCEKLLLI